VLPRSGLSRVVGTDHSPGTFVAPGKLYEFAARYVMNTGAGRTKAEDLIDKHDYLRIDNNHLTAEAAARAIVEAFTLA
jgi:hypothetical protein